MMRGKDIKRKRLDKRLERVDRLLRAVGELRAPLAARFRAVESPWLRPELDAAHNRFEGLSNRFVKLLRIRTEITEQLAQNKLKNVRRSGITREMYCEAWRKTRGNKTCMAEELKVTRQALWEWEQANL